jgi:hypothetical protein
VPIVLPLRNSLLSIASFVAFALLSSLVAKRRYPGREVEPAT